MKIEVFENQIEPALKALKKEMLKGGGFKEMKRRADEAEPSVNRYAASHRAIDELKGSRALASIQ